jgi:Aspartyl protease
MKRSNVSSTLLFIVSSLILGAASFIGAAPFSFAQNLKTPAASKIVSRSGELPRPVSFREVKERGLLIKVWVNQTGPYTFAIDTGAGVNLIGSQAAARSGAVPQGGAVSISGLSGVASSNGRTTVIHSLAIGDAENVLRLDQKAVIVENLPSGVDGLFDPTDAYFPLGVSLDLPNHEMAAFNPKINPLLITNPPAGGTVVHWLNPGGGRRPFVRLGDGRMALLDTGSRFGLAITQGAGDSVEQRRSVGVHDVGGGEVTAKRVQPQTVTIGEMTLRAVPTDVLFGVEKGAPLLLGRDALYPFRLSFDPLQRLIEIEPLRR